MTTYNAKSLFQYDSGCCWPVLQLITGNHLSVGSGPNMTMAVKVGCKAPSLILTNMKELYAYVLMMSSASAMSGTDPFLRLS